MLRPSALPIRFPVAMPSRPTAQRPQPPVRFGSQGPQGPQPTQGISPLTSQTALSIRLAEAVQAAREAGSIIMRHFHDPGLDVSRKANDEIVTTADKEADEAIRARLSRAFPQDKLLTEESFDPTQPIDLSQTWIVDPLDATRNFANKIPHFAVSLAYLENGQPKLGVIYDPLKDEMFTAVKGEPTRLNGRAIQVNKDTALEKSVVSLPFPYPKRILDTKIPNRRLGCAALDMAYVAAGRLGAASERNLKVWDVVAGLPLLEGAGGSLTDATGNPLDLTQKRFHYVASNTRLHEPMLRLLQDA